MKTSSQLPAAGEQVDVVAQEDPPSAISNLFPLNEEARSGMIAEAAYYRAEARGFAPGHEEEDWLEAEAEVDLLLASSEPKPLRD